MADSSAGDVVEILTTDHREMLELLRQIEKTDDPTERRSLADAVTAEVMRHSVAEELFVYPVMERELPNGADEVEHDKQEHKEIEATLKKLEGADAAGAQFMELVAELIDLLDHHADD